MGYGEATQGLARAEGTTTPRAGRAEEGGGAARSLGHPGDLEPWRSLLVRAGTTGMLGMPPQPRMRKNARFSLPLPSLTSTSYWPNPTGTWWQERMENVISRGQHPPRHAHTLQSSAGEGWGADLRATGKRPEQRVRRVRKSVCDVNAPEGACYVSSKGVGAECACVLV